MLKLGNGRLVDGQKLLAFAVISIFCLEHSLFDTLVFNF
jgi:hypothetical protein